MTPSHALEWTYVGEGSFDEELIQYYFLVVLFQARYDLICVKSAVKTQAINLLVLFSFKLRLDSSDWPWSFTKRMLLQAKFHYAILVADRSEAGRRPATSWNLAYHLAR